VKPRLRLKGRRKIWEGRGCPGLSSQKNTLTKVTGGNETGKKRGRDCAGRGKKFEGNSGKGSQQKTYIIKR